MMTARFALIERPDDAQCKPKIYPSATALALDLHERRGRRPIYTQDISLVVEGETHVRKGVSVWAINVGDDVDADYLGWVFIGNLGRHELGLVMDRADPLVTAGKAA